MNFQNSILVGLILRLLILRFLNYTDIDYFVYSDGAKYILQGGSPYDRHTYRYTPILGYMMIPNIIFHD